MQLEIPESVLQTAEHWASYDGAMALPADQVNAEALASLGLWVVMLNKKLKDQNDLRAMGATEVECGAVASPPYKAAGVRQKTPVTFPIPDNVRIPAEFHLHARRMALDYDDVQRMAKFILSLNDKDND